MQSQLHSPRGLFEDLVCDDKPKKLGAIIWSLMMARKIVGGAVLGRHPFFMSLPER